MWFFFFFQAEDGIRYGHVTGVQTCALPISFLGSHITASLPLLYPTQYRVQHERVLRHPPARAAPRHHRARVPAAAAHTGLRLRPARGAPAPRLRHRCEHAVPPAAAPRDARPPPQPVPHRRAPPPPAPPHVCRRPP